MLHHGFPEEGFHDTKELYGLIFGVVQRGYLICGCRQGSFSGGGMPRQAWGVPPDAGAMPRTATYLVNGKGFGQPRQRR